jgi:hypothetical protein
MAKKDFGSFTNVAVQQTKTVEQIIRENITILEEIKDWIPPLTEEEFEQLAKNIAEEGCRDALIIWEKEEDGNKKYILVDGHNRYAICTKLKKDFRFELRTFKDIEQVQNWMIINQLGKRNITEDEKSYLRGVQYKIEKKQGQRTDLTSGQNDQKLETREKLAIQHKVSAKTIQRDEKYAESVDKIAGEDNKLKWDILKKNYNIPKSELIEIAEQGETAIQALRERITAGENFQAEESQSETKAGKPATKAKVDTGKFIVDDLKPFQSNIYQAVREVMTKQDDDAVEKLKTRVEELAKEIQKRKK